MIQRKIAKGGKLTIPREMRAELGITVGSPVDISCRDFGIYISKHVPCCRFCGETANVSEVFGIEICRGCAEKIMEVFNNGTGCTG